MAIPTANAAAALLLLFCGEQRAAGSPRTWSHCTSLAGAQSSLALYVTTTQLLTLCM